MYTAADIPATLGANARVWIYQSNRAFREQEELEINEQLLHFYSQWLAHGQVVNGWAGVLYHQFVVVVADEQTGAAVSGCSTDGMVRVIKSLEKQYQVQLFDRMAITFLINDKVEMLPMGQVQYALDKGYINAQTLMYNNTVATKQELMDGWLQPLAQSWLAARLQLPTQ